MTDCNGKTSSPSNASGLPSEIKPATVPDILAFYGVQSLDELDTKRAKAIRKEYDMLTWMSADDPPLWMKNGHTGGPALRETRGTLTTIRPTSGVLKRTGRGGRDRERSLSRQDARLAPKPEVSMIDFFFKHLDVQ